MGDQFKVNFQLTKIDLEKREVWGRAIEEVPDRAREIMDYSTSKPRFQKWSEDARKRTAILPVEQQSLGNVREMHEPIAAGKVIAIDFVDGEKAIDIGTYCADDDSWKKILNGTLTGFSVGGHYAKRWLDPGNPTLTRYTADPVEVSYVDAPAVPTALFTMIKSDGSRELRKVGEPLEEIMVVCADDPLTQQPLERVQAGQEARTIPVVADEHLSNNLIDENRAVAPISEPRNDPAEKVDEPDWVKAFTAAVQTLEALKVSAEQDKAKAESMLKTMGTRVGIARRESAPYTPPTGYPTESSDYGDPANWSYPLNDRERAESAMAQFNAGMKKGDYSEREWHILGRRIADKASALFDKRYQYSPLAKAVNSEDKRMGSETTTTLEKVNLGPLVQQIQAAIQAGVDQIGKNPEAAKDLLMHAIGDLDGAVSVEPINPGGTSVPTAPTGSQAGVTDTMLKAAGAATTSTPSASSTSEESYKKLVDQVEMLTQTVAKLADDLSAQKKAGTAATTPGDTTTTPPSASTSTMTKVEQPVPLGDLAALLNNTVPHEVDAVIKALLEGGNDAFKKAAIAAGAGGKPDEIAVKDRAFEAVKSNLRSQFQNRGNLPGFFGPESVNRG